MFTFLTRSSFSGTDRESEVSSYEYDEEFEMLVKAYMRDINYTSVNQAALNIACSTINAGLIALPFAAQEVGIPIYIATMTALTLISSYTSILVVSMAAERRVRTLEDLAECAFGVRGFFLVSSLQLLFSFTLMCVTLNVWADIMSDVFRQSNLKSVSFLHQRHYQIYFGALFVLPFCLLKKSLSQLRWTSFVTVFAVIGALLSVIATYISDAGISHSFSSEHAFADVCRPKSYWWTLLFISVFSFSCNQKVLTIYSSLRRRSSERWTVAVRRGLLCILSLYLLFGSFGYLAKDSKQLRISGFNYFLNDQEEIKAVFDPARIIFALSLLLTMPVDSLILVTTYRRLWSKFIKFWGLGEHLKDGQALTCGNVCCGSPGGAFPGSIEATSRERDEEEEYEERHETDAERQERLERERKERTSSSVFSSLAALLPPRVVSHKKGREYKRVKTEEDTRDRSRDKDKRDRDRERSGMRSTGSTTEEVYNGLNHNEGSGGGGVIGDAEETTEERDNNREETEEEDIEERESYRSDRDNRERPGDSPQSQSNPPPGFFSSQSTRSIFNAFSNSNSNTTTLHYLGGGGHNGETYEQYQHLLEATSFLPERSFVVPTCLFWLCTICVTLFIRHWMYLAASIGVLATLLLLFLIPGMLYFKLGLVSDYQAQPLVQFGGIVLLPNQVYAAVLVVLGSLILVFDVILDVYFTVTGARIIESHS